MLVSHRYRFILIKTRKTAGSSLEGLLEPLCVSGDHVAGHRANEIVSGAGIVAARAGGERGKRGLGAHVSAKEIRRLVGPKVFDSYSKIIPIRDPFDKVVSWYWHVMPASIKERVADDFDAARSLFRDWMKMRPKLNKDTMFYKTSKGRFDATLVRYESLGADLENLSRVIGHPLSLDDLPKWKSGKRMHRERGVDEYYDLEAADLVRRHFQFDFRHFGYDPDRVCPRGSGASS